ncbi:hypothetical protein [Limnoglobus roseus]|uniref:TIGR03000 domain-containing protein n=1 Tax=Limnoglobus roseus TaxID=2598579 RepID=A0A5C1ANZ9_9BACT|nr:hypothetical protein [Limnoglobus roseus]QEL19863.1 hypothetical protein PX52LOC_06944 [Limnoglobus roseus]
MRKYISGLALLLAAFASEAAAQYQTVITPPAGGVPIVAGGWYTAGTVFANGMAYPAGPVVEDVGSVAQASYSVPTVVGYPASFGSNYYYGGYPQSSYYGPGYSSFGLGIGFGTSGYGYNRGYAGYGFRSYPSNRGYGGYSNFGPGYGRGYSGNRGYGGGNGGRRR